jgi:hypothetical protein
MHALRWLLENTPFERDARAIHDEPKQDIWEWMREDFLCGIISRQEIALRMVHHGVLANVSTSVTAYMFEDGSAFYAWKNELFVVPDVALHLEVLHECHPANH